MPTWISETLTVISLLASTASLILAVFTINYSRNSEKETRSNFEKTREIIADQNQRLKESLAEIDKRSTMTEQTVKSTQEQLIGTITRIANDAVPRQIDPATQATMAFFNTMLQDPERAGTIIETMNKITTQVQQPKGQVSRRSQQK